MANWYRRNEAHPRFLVRHNLARPEPPAFSFLPIAFFFSACFFRFNLFFNFFFSARVKFTPSFVINELFFPGFGFSSLESDSLSDSSDDSFAWSFKREAPVFESSTEESESLSLLSRPLFPLPIIYSELSLVEVNQ